MIFPKKRTKSHLKFQVSFLEGGRERVLTNKAGSIAKVNQEALILVKGVDF
jgi:hypothetical protein